MQIISKNHFSGHFKMEEKKRRNINKFMMKIIIAVCWSGGRVKSFIFSFFFIGRMNEKRRNNEISRRVLWEFYFTGLPRLLWFDVCFRGCYRASRAVKLLRVKWRLEDSKCCAISNWKYREKHSSGWWQQKASSETYFNTQSPMACTLKCAFLTSIPSLITLSPFFDDDKFVFTRIARSPAIAQL